MVTIPQKAVLYGVIDETGFDAVDLARHNSAESVKQVPRDVVARPGVADGESSMKRTQCTYIDGRNGCAIRPLRLV
jgi:hypothetical protein